MEPSKPHSHNKDGGGANGGADMNSLENQIEPGHKDSSQATASEALLADAQHSPAAAPRTPMDSPIAKTEAPAAPNEISFEPINSVIENQKKSDAVSTPTKELPNLLRDQTVMHSEYSTVVTRKGDHPNHHYELTVNPTTGDASFKYADGRNLEIKMNPDGSRTALSTGPSDKDNFELHQSADRRTETMKFKDGRVITYRTEKDRTFKNLSSRGPDKFDNFEMSSDRQIRYWNPIATYQDFPGAKGHEAVDRAFDEALRVTFARGKVTIALADRYFHYDKPRERK